MLTALAAKYKLTNAHLGDQDMYTLLALEHPQLFAHLPCQWNRQLCRYWFGPQLYAAEEPRWACPGPVHLWHGNCNSKFAPELLAAHAPRRRTP